MGFILQFAELEYKRLAYAIQYHNEHKKCWQPFAEWNMLSNFMGMHIQIALITREQTLNGHLSHSLTLFVGLIIHSLNLKLRNEFSMFDKIDPRSKWIFVSVYDRLYCQLKRNISARRRYNKCYVHSHIMNLDFALVARSLWLEYESMPAMRRSISKAYHHRGYNRKKVMTMSIW